MGAEASSPGPDSTAPGRGHRERAEALGLFLCVPADRQEGWAAEMLVGWPDYIEPTV